MIDDGQDERHWEVLCHSDQIKELEAKINRLQETILYFRKQFQRFTNKGIAYCQYDIERCDKVLGLTEEEKKELDNSSSGCPVSGGGG